MALRREDSFSRAATNSLGRPSGIDANLVAFRTQLIMKVWNFGSCPSELYQPEFAHT